jgi:hypothetical protein
MVKIISIAGSVPSFGNLNHYSKVMNTLLSVIIIVTWKIPR